MAQYKLTGAVISRGRVKVNEEGNNSWNETSRFTYNGMQPDNISKQGDTFIATYPDGTVYEYDEYGRRNRQI